MAEHNLIGQKGEREAVAYLRSNGYEIIACNWIYLKAELDIVAYYKGLLVVVEVKTRSDVVFGEPEVFVTRAKQKNIIKAANAYVLENDLDIEVRFDIISVVLKGNKSSVHHIENAFYAVLK